jgi:hypothetical protein
MSYPQGTRIVRDSHTTYRTGLCRATADLLRQLQEEPLLHAEERRPSRSLITRRALVMYGRYVLSLTPAQAADEAEELRRMA